MFLNGILLSLADIDKGLLLEQVLRVIACVIIGGAIGYEREIKAKPAGFVTFILVCVGSCIIAILQENLFLANQDHMDRSRIIAQVVSGIGFLGAGTILYQRGAVKGITTAAMLWLVAALGIMVGSGGTLNYIIAAITVVVVLPTVIIARRFGEKISTGRRIYKIRILFEENCEKELFEFFATSGVTIRKSYFVNKIREGKKELKESYIYLSLPKGMTLNELLEKLSAYNEIYEVSEA